MYDIISCKRAEFHEGLMPLVRLHCMLKPEYDRRLLCTLIIVHNDTLAKVLNMVLTTMYTPTRPLKLSSSNHDYVKLISDMGGLKIKSEDRVDA